MRIVFLVLTTILILSLAACSIGPAASEVGLVKEIPKPELSTFSCAIPTSVGDFTQDRALSRGDALFLSNGKAQLWLRRLGTSSEGRSKWQCSSNHQYQSQPCQKYENGKQLFLWNGLTIAYSEGENGRLKVDQGWQITTALP